VGAIEEARNIIALAVDPAACRSRLAKIEKLSEQTAAALLKLMAERKVHNEKVERDRAELEAVREKLLNKEINLRDREGRLASDQEILERQKTTYAIATMSHLWTARRCRGSQILGRIKTPPITTLARTNEGRLNGAARHHDQRS
jgi:hypothetical protein